MAKPRTYTTVCYTCLKQFSQAEATHTTRRLFTEGSPFSDGPQEESLLEEARLLASFSEAVSALANTCEDSCPEFDNSIMYLLTLLAEETRLRLSEARLVRERYARVQLEGENNGTPDTR